MSVLSIFSIELLLWFIIEVVFWGIIFWTGYATIFVLSFGKWKISNDGDRKKQRKETRFILTALIGFLFWLGIGIAFMIFL